MKYSYPVILTSVDSAIMSMYACCSKHNQEDSSKRFATDSVERIKASALRMLGRRSHSKKELRKKLEERGYDHTDISTALNRLEEVGLQSDREFAMIFARSKWRQSKWGPNKIRTVRDVLNGLLLMVETII